MSIVTGYTFGSTELVTNTKLNNAVNNASIAGMMPIANLCYLGTSATNASIISVSSMTGVKLYASTYCSISSISGVVNGQIFTLFAQQASFPTLVDTGIFKLNGNWYPASACSNLTLVWDGTNYVEIGRVGV